MFIFHILMSLDMLKSNFILYSIEEDEDISLFTEVDRYFSISYQLIYVH